MSHTAVSIVLYAVDESLWCWIVLRFVAIVSATYVFAQERFAQQLHMLSHMPCLLRHVTCRYWQIVTCTTLGVTHCDIAMVTVAMVMCTCSLSMQVLLLEGLQRISDMVLGLLLTRGQNPSIWVASKWKWCVVVVWWSGGGQVVVRWWSGGGHVMECNHRHTSWCTLAVITTVCDYGRNFRAVTHHCQYLWTECTYSTYVCTCIGRMSGLW